VFARGKTYGDIHNVTYVSTADGKVITFDIAGVHPLIGDKIEVGLDGVSLPDINGRCEKERELARQARNIVRHLLKRARDITLRNVSRGRYFRIVATVLVDGKDLRQVLIAAGLAVPYSDGKTTGDWCAGKSR